MLYLTELLFFFRCLQQWAAMYDKFHELIFTG